MISKEVFCLKYAKTTYSEHGKTRIGVNALTCNHYEAKTGYIVNRVFVYKVL